MKLPLSGKNEFQEMLLKLALSKLFMKPKKTVKFKTILHLAFIA
jgi:hypothetical protein